MFVRDAGQRVATIEATKETASVKQNTPWPHHCRPSLPLRRQERKKKQLAFHVYIIIGEAYRNEFR